MPGLGWQSDPIGGYFAEAYDARIKKIKDEEARIAEEKRAEERRIRQEQRGEETERRSLQFKQSIETQEKERLEKQGRARRGGQMTELAIMAHGRGEHELGDYLENTTDITDAELKSIQERLFTKPKEEYITVGDQLFNPRTQQFITPPTQGLSSAQVHAEAAARRDMGENVRVTETVDSKGRRSYSIAESPEPKNTQDQQGVRGRAAQAKVDAKEPLTPSEQRDLAIYNIALKEGPWKIGQSELEKEWARKQMTIGGAASEYLHPQTLMQPQPTDLVGAVEAAGYKKVSDKEQAALSELGPIDTMFKNLSRMSGQINTSRTTLQRLKQGVGAFVGKTIQPTDSALVAAYDKELAAFVVTFGRAIAGLRGTDSDRDVARMTKAFPSIYDRQEVAEMSLAFIESVIESIKTARHRQAFGAPDDPKVLESRLDRLFTTLEKNKKLSKQGSPVGPTSPANEPQAPTKPDAGSAGSKKWWDAPGLHKPGGGPTKETP